jgi:hypothetical protein
LPDATPPPSRWLSDTVLDMAPDRRACPRWQLRQHVVVAYVARVARPRYGSDWAILDNNSLGGVGLHLAQCPEPGTTLYVQLHPGGQEEPINRRVRVVHVRPSGVLLWFLGGAFVEPRTPVDLHRVLNGRQSGKPGAPALAQVAAPPA